MIGLVLAGGASRRMGRPKALLPVEGVALAARVATVLQAAGAEQVVLVGGDAAWSEVLGLAHAPDRWPGDGPLAGLASGLAAAQAGGPAMSLGGDGVVAADGLAVAVACDQVALTPEVIAALVEALRAAGPHVVAAAPRTPDGRRHPFPTVWRTGAATALVALVERDGARRADAAFTVGPVLDVAVSAEVLVDLDTPADLARWEQREHIVPE